MQAVLHFVSKIWGESLLFDTGYAGNEGRDVNRILAAAKDAGVSKIDYLVISHFHGDHVGGAPELSTQIPIGAFVDRGLPPEKPDPRVLEPFRAYAAVRASGRHIVARPGESLPLKGLEVQIVSSAG
ncbi:MAG: MBL fold metallo-hydrolase, partial [Caldilinea sp. CFX5]|nr:MBL fold metallo-hydrolase [Caldilinea sp. CFX5]